MSDTRVEEALERKISRDANVGLTKSSSKIMQDGLSREVTAAIERGVTPSEKKAAWPFDIYQGSDYYPTDYRFWKSEVASPVGNIDMVMMHSTIWTSDNCELAADTVHMRNKMGATHKVTMKSYFREIGVNLDPLRQYKQSDSFRSSWQELLQQAKARREEQETSRADISDF
eukprot:GHVH01000821.1.p1 GENE.GHVH01000821.1~~GHVH01000821.1.p1  ORF type:complete len:172 (+),score=17.38 GHVH01000821.1:785-1300(+)